MIKNEVYNQFINREFQIIIIGEYYENNHDRALDVKNKTINFAYRLIGKDNSLPWSIKEDMNHFKNYTTGKTVLMGKKTFDSIGKPLANRNNIVIV